MAPVCPECGAKEPEYDGPGEAIESVGMLHTRDCPTLAWMMETKSEVEKPKLGGFRMCSCPFCC